MSDPQVRFSLRSLFLATTLIATFIAAAAKFPIALVVMFFLASPLAFVAFMANLHNQKIKQSINTKVDPPIKHENI